MNNSSADRRLRKSLWVPSTAFSENMPRTSRMDNLPLPVSGTLVIVGGCEMHQGEVCKGVGFVSGSTALAGGTSRWGLLLDVNRKVLGVSADQGAAAWAASTPMPHQIATAFEAPTDMPVYTGLLIIATTVPSLYGADTQNNVVSLMAPKLVVNDATGMTGLASPPAVGTTIAADGGAHRQVPYTYLY